MAERDHKSGRTPTADVPHAETLGASEAARAVERLGTPIDQNDPIERWGRRIGRTLGFIAVALLALHLYVTYLVR
jgi:hypothetical protein